MFYDKIEEDNYLENQLIKLLSIDVFTDVIITSKRQQINTTGDDLMIANETSGMQYKISRPIPYNEFLKRINKQTKISDSIIK